MIMIIMLLLYATQMDNQKGDFSFFLFSSYPLLLDIRPAYLDK